MADSFNPYRSWLGVVSASLPPTHYELLGVSATHCDAQLVAEAFRRQMGRLNPHLSGEHASVAQRIAGELSNARVVLLTPTTKRAYDAELASRGQTASSSLSTLVSATDDLLPPTAGPVVSAPAAGPVGAPPANQPPPPTPAPVAYPSAPTVAPYAQPAAYAQPASQPMPLGVVPAMGQMGPGVYQPAPGMAYGQHYSPQGYPAQATYPVGQVMPGQPAYSGQAFPAPQAMPMQSAAYPSTAPQPELPGPAVAPSPSRSVSRTSGARRSSAVPMLIGMLIVGLVAVGGVAYYALVVEPDAQQVAAGDPSPPPVGNPDAKSKRADAAPSLRVSNDSIDRNRKPAKHLKVEPVKAASPQEKLFNDHSDPSPDPAPAMPAETSGADKPKGEMAKPEAKPASPDNPPDSPTAPPPASDDEKAAVGEALAAARRALAGRNFAEADDQVAQATLAATAPELLAEIDRVQLMAQYLKDFWEAAQQHMAKLGAAETITVDGEELSIIEASEEKIILRVAGKRREYTFEKLPPKLAYWLADNWLDKSNPASLATLGAYHALDAKGDRQKARQLFDEAAAAGFDAGPLLAELDSQSEGK